jgi:hypothetical protein
LIDPDFLVGLPQTLNATIALHKGRATVAPHMNKQSIFNIKNDKE